MPRKDFNIPVSRRRYSVEGFRQAFFNNRIDAMTLAIFRHELETDEGQREDILAELWPLSHTYSWAWDALHRLALFAVSRGENPSWWLKEFANQVATAKLPRPKPKRGQRFSDMGQNFAIGVSVRCLMRHCGMTKIEACKEVTSWLGKDRPLAKDGTSVPKIIEKLEKQLPILYGHKPDTNTPI